MRTKPNRIPQRDHGSLVSSVEGKVLTGNHGFRTGKYRGFLQKFPLNLFWDGKESAHTLLVVPCCQFANSVIETCGQTLGGMCFKLFHKRSLYLCTSTKYKHINSIEHSEQNKNPRLNTFTHTLW